MADQGKKAGKMANQIQGIWFGSVNVRKELKMAYQGQKAGEMAD